MDGINSKEEKLITWTHPPSGWYALNSDDAARGSPGMQEGEL